MLLAEESGTSEISAEDYAIAIADLVEQGDHAREASQRRLVSVRGSRAQANIRWRVRKWRDRAMTLAMATSGVRGSGRRSGSYRHVAE
jgi:hypothetical protein